MSTIIEILIYIAGCLLLMVGLIWVIIWCIGVAFKLGGNYNILIKAIRQVAIESKDKENK